MSQSYEFDSGHADEIGHTDLDAGKQVLNEVIQECQHSLEGIKHVRLALESQSRGRSALSVKICSCSGGGLEPPTARRAVNGLNPIGSSSTVQGLPKCR